MDDLAKNNPVTLADVDLAAEDYRRAHDVLSDRLAALRDAQARLRDQHLPHLRQAVIAARQARDAVVALIETQPDLFAKPKSRTMHGIVVGLRKLPDQYLYPSDAALIRLIRDQLPALAGALIETQERPVKAAVKALRPDEQAQISVVKVTGADRVVVEPVDSEVDKLLAALLGDVLAEIEAETAP